MYICDTFRTETNIIIKHAKIVLKYWDTDGHAFMPCSSLIHDTYKVHFTFLVAYFNGRWQHKYAGDNLYTQFDV